MAGPTPFATYGADFTTAFSAGTASTVSDALTAVASPMSTLIVLWVIVIGILVMRGQIDTRAGVTRMIRVALVSAFVLETGVYNEYVTSLFQTTLPAWIAASVSGGASTTTPGMFDTIWRTVLTTCGVIQQQLNWYEIVDQIELALVVLSTGLLLLLSFSIFIVAQVMTTVIVAIGPFIIAGFLFDATRNVSERWIGKLIGLALLSLLVDVTMAIILTGEQSYLAVTAANATSATGTPAVAVQILFESTMFIAIGTFITVSLPAIAAAIGGGVALNAAGPVLNAVIGGAAGYAGATSRSVQKSFRQRS